MNSILKAENIFYSVSQKNEEKIILKNISFELERNSVLGISGESGSGKTTLAKILAGIIKQTSGKIDYFFSRDFNKISPVQILFQNTGEIINPLREVKDMLNESLVIAKKNNIETAKLDAQLFFSAIKLIPKKRNCFASLFLCQILFSLSIIFW